MTKNLLDDYEEETIAITDCKLDHDPSRDCNYYNTNPLLHMHSNVDGLKNRIYRFSRILLSIYR